MSIQSDPCRVVRTLNSEVALLGHGLETDGDILYEFMHDSQTNKVSILRSTHARYGIEFVEANESIQPLIDYANANKPHPPNEVVEEEQFDPADTNKDGLISNKERKQFNKG